MTEKFDLAKTMRGEYVKKANSAIAQAVRHCKKHPEISGIRKVVLEQQVFIDKESGDITIVGDIKASFPGLRDQERFILARKLVEQNGQLTFESAAKDPAVKKKEK